MRPESKTEKRENEMRKQKGFSLIELLIVVAIILIIAAIAIPNLLRARMAANESSAVSSIRTVNTAEVSYQSTYQNGYSTSLAQLGPAAAGACTAPTAANACLIDYSLSTATASTAPKSGYYFTFTTLSTATSYVIGGQPQKANQTGISTFCSSEDGVLHKDVTGATPPTTVDNCSKLAALQ